VLNRQLVLNPDLRPVCALFFWAFPVRIGRKQIMREFDIEKFVRRLGRFHVEQRLNMQAHHAADILGPGLVHVHIENMLWLHRLHRTLERS
jgi:hypothetical protein